MACEKHRHIPQVTTVKFRNYCEELAPPCPSKVRWRDPSLFYVSNFDVLLRSATFQGTGRLLEVELLLLLAPNLAVNLHVHCHQSPG